MQEEIKKEGTANVQVTFSEDELEAYLYIGGTEEDIADCTLESLMRVLGNEGVAHGINQDAIKMMLAKKIVGQPVKVAEGTKPVDGKDGWYEFFFETVINDKPKILKDGSVDYSTYGDLPTVFEGDEVAEYHRPTESADGKTVRGVIIPAKKGKDLAKLKGRGFVVDETGFKYLAKHDGKVTYIDERLVVDKELVVEGDVSFNTGNIEFQSDIHIKGNILSGVSVKSIKGSIIVDGYVELANLSAGKDVTLKNGMQGNGKGSIEAGGDVKGKFFEQVKIRCGGDVNANAIMNSNIECGQDIIVSGKHGIIIGGTVSAVRYISTNIIGNMSEVKATIKAGVDGDLFAQLALCEQNIAELESGAQKLANALEQIQILIEKTGREDLQQKKVLLTRKKIESDLKIGEYTKKKQDIVEIMGKANLAKVTIEKVIYPGTTISINGMKVIVHQENHHVEYARRGAGIVVYNIGE